MNAVIIGSGNVAEAFARALPEAGMTVVQIFARNAVRGRMLAGLAGCGWTDKPSELAAAELYIAAVSDRAIGEVLQPLSLPDGSVAVHVSGAQPLSVIPEKFARRGVVYPLQTFTAGRRVDFAEIPLFLEASDGETLSMLHEFASGLSKNIFDMDSAHRARLHLTGVFACNFVNAMYGAANRIAAEAGVPFGILTPMIEETARKAVESGNPESVQTGPAIRHDRVTMERHCELLASAGDAELLTIYETVSKYIYGKKL